MAWQTVRQQRIYYESLGYGDAVLLLPGWAGSIIEFDRLRHELSAGFRVIAADLPGSGRSQPQPRDYAPAFYAEDAHTFRTFLDDLDVHAAHQVRHTGKWRLAVEMIEEMTSPGGWGVLEQITTRGAGRPVMVSDIGYGDNALFRQELTAAGWQYVVAVKGSPRAYPAGATPEARSYGGLGQPPKPAYPNPAASLRQLAIARADAVRLVTWRQGTKATRGNPEAAMTSHFLAIRVRPAGRHITREADRSFPPCWLLAEWPPHADEPDGYWLSTLPDDTPIEELVRLAKIRWRIEHDYRELRHGLGLDHFEGRSYLGWHRHVTLAALAQAFCTMIRSDPKARAPG
jgi:DDE superfamily endonuclease/alpha/beta hydrolase family protein